jgi:beta-catenin-like protein 1
MESEVDLDEEIKKLAVLATAPTLYPDIVKLNTIPSILSLLSHENTDIAADVVDLLNELTDPDNFPENEEAYILITTLVHFQ